MISNKIIFSFIVISFFFIYSGCKDNPAQPNEEDIPEGRRDYKWTIDTLYYPYNTIYKIWGSAPSDVWAISPGGDLNKTIFRFDGVKWKVDQISRPLSPLAIFGFSYDNIFLGGQNGMIWHFDGINLKEVSRLKIEGSDQLDFFGIWGTSTNDLYAFGAYPDGRGYLNNSVIAHLTNNTWKILNTDGLKGIITNLFKNEYDNHIYLSTSNPGGGEHYDSSLVYQYYQGKYNKLYSSVDTKGLIANISFINNEVYFILGNEIAKRRNNQFQTFLKVDNKNFYQRIWGRNQNDIFLFMTNGLAHYNGKDIQYLCDFDKLRTQIFGAILFESDVFFIVYESATHLNLIYHGILE